MEWIYLRRRAGVLCIIVGFLTILSTCLITFGEPKTVQTAGAQDTPVLIIDPGHGGEDGGAVAADGTEEAAINLAIALRLNAAARLCGVQTVMTRSTAQIDYPENAATIAERKVADQRQRVDQINAVSNGLLISIHQNYYPAPAPRGAQVLYADSEQSRAFGAMLHDALRSSLDPENRRVASPAAGDIYLMKNVRCPAVLVECGFLSNPDELQKLRDESYETKLSLVMLGCYLEFTKTGWNQ